MGAGTVCQSGQAGEADFWSFMGANTVHGRVNIHGYYSAYKRVLF